MATNQRMPPSPNAAVDGAQVATVVAEGDKVVVEMKEWESRHTNPEGEVIEVLGAPDKEGVDMLSVLRHYDLPLSFPRNVLREARANGKEVTRHRGILIKLPALVIST